MKVDEVRFLFIDPTFTSEKHTKGTTDFGKSDREKKYLDQNLKLRCGMNLHRQKLRKNVLVG